MPDIKDTRTVIDSLNRCRHVGDYANTPPGETCDDCAYYGKCSDLELDAAELILLLDELTDHQFWINPDTIKDLRHCGRCGGETAYYSECQMHNVYGANGCDKIQEYAADILKKMYSRYNIGHALGHRNRMYPSTLISCDGFRGGKIYDVKTIHKEDIKDTMDATAYFASIVNQIKELDRKRFETSFTPRSIEQSADHKTVCVLWQDGSKTIVKLSDNDKDDIDTAFAYALAKKVFRTNTHLKKVVQQKLNEHKPKNKKVPSDPNPKEIPVESEYIKAAKELFLESHIIYDIQIGIDLMDTGETRVHMYNSREGVVEYMKNVESTQDALSKFESMWQQFNTEKEAEDAPDC